VWAEAKELWNYRSLLFSMVQRELTVRYKNSFLGFFWSMINPLLTVVVLTFVFKVIQKNNTPNFSAYILAAYLPYMFFQMAIMDSAQSILGSLGLLKKIYFPREILPLASIISNYVHFLLALAVFFVYLLAIYIAHPALPVFQWTTLYLPVLLLINLLLAAGLGLLFSALNTFYEDVKYLVGVALSLLFFLSPIMYFSENTYYPDIPGKSHLMYYLYHLNPIATLSTAYRKVLLAPQPVNVGGIMYPPLPLDWRMIGITGVFSVIIFFYGYHVFNKMKWRFVERP
jgi:lipopolysaccharide transport system permease protein